MRSSDPDDRGLSDVEQSPADVGPNQCAYVMYTSGSTGAPKGVMVADRNLTSFLDAMGSLFPIGPGDVVPALTTPCFDISGLEMLLPLVNGATVVIVDRETASDGRRLRRFLAASAATLVQATPATWRLLIDAGWTGDSRQTLLCGGEAMTSDLALELIARSRAVWNMYGPTETTIWSSAYHVTSAAPGEPVPIGPAIRGTTLYVLDDRLCPVSSGVVGELYIGGDGVAIGYLNRPKLTAERFLPDPFAGRPDARMYRTGDRVRGRADGTFEYIGRTDHQVKIHGFRVELGEIEAALRDHRDVRQAVVVVDDQGSRGRRLVGYVTSDRSEDSLARELRRHLVARIPGHMVPTRINSLSAFPLTANGKIDRNALQALCRQPSAAGRSDSSDERRFPVREISDPLEQKLTECWARVLETSAIDPSSNFFDLGGDSLDAARLVCEIEASLGCDIPASTLIDAPTVAQLGEVIRRQRAGVTSASHAVVAPLAGSTSETFHAAAVRWPTLVPIRPSGTAPPMFVIHGGGGTVLFAASLAKGVDPARPVFGFQLQGLDGWDATPRSVEELAAAYVEGIRSVRPSGPYHLVGFCFGGLVAFEMAQQLHRSGDTVGLLALLNTPHPHFDAPTAAPRRLAIDGIVARCGAALTWRWDVVRAGARTLPHWLRVVGAHAYATTRRQIPVKWRADYLYRLTDRATIRYRPYQYDGTLTVIVGRGMGPALSVAWRDLARQVVMLEIGPRQRLRRDLVREPIAHELAARINERLSAAENSFPTRTAQSSSTNVL
jgi:amino acid adenylation domain-containing protein